MLVDPNNTSVSTKQYVAMVVAHELAHQWFGNLVTMRWWTDLWLNEGFASWIEYMAIDHIFPEWQMWTQFAVDEQHRAFKLDALENTHAIEVPIHHPDEIRSIFDTISYSKGASVLHMLHAYLGAKDFRDGLRHYLRKHEYGNTDTVDLWEALEHISKKPVRQFMDSWTTQSGFPIISIDTSNTKTTISQERFFINPKHDKSPKTLWPISLQANVKDLPEIMDETSISINGHMTSLKLNQSQTGFYRVDYDIEQLAEFGKLVKSAKLTPIDRLGILSDAFESAKAGFTPTIEVFKFLDYFGDEDNNAVWDVIATGIGATRTVMDDEQLREDMKSYIASLTSKQYKRLGWKQLDNENYFDTLLRPTILGLSTGADVSEAVNTALELFDKSKTIDNIEPDLRSLILATAVRLRNDNKTFDKLFNMYQSSNLSEEKTVLAAALSSFKSPRLYKKALGIIKTDHVRPQDISYWVVYSFSNRFAKRETWEWMTKNWKWLEKIIGNDLSFYRFPLYAANAFSDDKFIPIYKKFFAKYNSSALDRSIKQGVETLEWQSEWKKRDIQSIKQFFTMK